jgi:glucokinase
MDTVLAVDLGASKFAAGLVDETGALSRVHMTAVDRTIDAEGLWDALSDLVDDVRSEAIEADEHPLAIGIGSAGPITQNLERVSPLNLPNWSEFPLRERMGELTGLPVAGDLDTKALALGEGWLGAARGHQNYVAMVVSTGIGGGIVLDGQLLDGASGNAGHIGHTIVLPDGRTCHCGAVGCLEAEASGWAILEMTGQSPVDASPAVVERTGRLVGRGVASVMNLLEVELAVVAGSVALGFGQPFFDAAQAEIDATCRLGPAGLRPAIVPAGLGDEAPLVGAGAVAWRALGRLPDAGD